MKVIDGKPEYKGAVDVIVKVVRNEGFFSLWKGFTPYYFRQVTNYSGVPYNVTITVVNPLARCAASESSKSMIC